MPIRLTAKINCVNLCLTEAEKFFQKFISSTADAREGLIRNAGKWLRPYCRHGTAAVRASLFLGDCAKADPDSHWGG
jgi:hypothetical protein